MDKPEELDLKLIVFGGILVMLLLAVSIIFFFIVYQKRLLSQQIHLQRVQSEYQRQLLASSIDAQERERARIGHDLHDELGSALSTIKLLINQIEWQGEESYRVIVKVMGILSSTIQDVRHISHNLHPSVLTKFGLADAIENLMIVISEASSIQVDYEIEQVSLLSSTQELALYRILQELVNNTLKHAKANQLSVKLKQSQRNVTLAVQDDGSGFNYQEQKNNLKAGLGLKSIEARTTMLRADLRVYSDASKGTRYQIILPLEKSSI